jgi:hypothetical protein
MTRARFKTEVKLFALNERSEGKGWKIIQKHIQEKYNIKAPTVRAMEKWGKSINKDSITAELMKDVDAQLPKMEMEAKASVTRNLLPVLLSAQYAGEDVNTAAWKWFFQSIENWMGLEKFEHLITEYFEERKKALAEGKKKEE